MAERRNFVCDWERGTFVLDGTEFSQELDIAREVDGVRIEEKKSDSIRTLVLRPWET